MAVTAAGPKDERRRGFRGFPLRPRTVGALTALVVAASAIASPAGAYALLAAGPGAVPGGCLGDASGQGTSEPQCGNRAAGLLGATAAAASPDGRSIYVASMDSDALVALRRSASGALHPVLAPSSRSCVAAPEHSICAQRAAGLGGADAVVVSPDGRNVYAGSLDSATVVAFGRTPGGLLVPLRGRGGCVQGNAVAPGDGGRCVLHSRAMQAVSSLAMSPDGRFVYALSFGTSAAADSLVTLRRDPRTGALSEVSEAHGGCVVPLGNGTCRIHAAGLRGASDIVVTADGRFVYVTGELSSAVVALSRNRHTGTISPLHGSGGCAEDIAIPPASGDGRCVVLVPGLGGAKALAISPDGRFVYVASFDPGGVAVLARNPATGTLGPLTGPGACLTPAGPDPAPAGCTAADSLRGATAVALAPGGGALYVAATTGNAVLRIDRDPGTGLLGALAPSHQIDGLNAPAGMALAPDGRNLYLASPIDNTVLSLMAG
jgi:DNA-binding beta-propeller fold protein YncE